jgi:TRAP-type C4-dicarboxylate transport system permease small subunit
MKSEKLVNSGISILCGFLLVVIVTVTFAQIVLRNFFASGLPWYDEVAQICMTWLVLFGAIWATKNNQHLNTGLKLHQKLKERHIRLIDGFLELVVAIITGVVAYRIGRFSLMSMDFSIVALPWLKLGYIFIVMPVAMLAICYYYLKNCCQNLIAAFKKVKFT